MASQNQTIPEQFRANQIIWLALLAGQILMAMVFVFLISQTEGGLNFGKIGDPVSMFLMIAIVLSVSCTALSFFMYNKRKEEIPSLKNLDEKIMHFRSTFILRASLLNGATMVCLIFMFMEENLLYLILALILMSILTRVRPTVDQFKNDYPLTSSERNQLQGVV